MELAIYHENKKKKQKKPTHSNSIDSQIINCLQFIRWSDFKEIAPKIAYDYTL